MPEIEDFSAGAGSPEHVIPVTLDNRALNASLTAAGSDVRRATESMRREFDDLNRAQDTLARGSKLLGRSFVSAFEGAIVQGKSLKDVLRSTAASISRSAYSSAIKPLEAFAGQAAQSLLSGLFTFGSGGVVGNVGGGRIVPMARGGVVDGPALAPLSGSRTALIGEAGPEAILPLQRGADGRLGVKAGGQGPAVNVTFNVTTPDAAGLTRSHTQIAALFSRSLSRARRNL